MSNQIDRWNNLRPANPLVGGIEIYNASKNVKKGTLGCVVKRGNQFFGLTAGHVLIVPKNNEVKNSDNIEDYVGFYDSSDPDSYNGKIFQPEWKAELCGIVEKKSDNFDFVNDAGIFLIKNRIANPNQHLNLINGKIYKVLALNEIRTNMSVMKIGSITNDTYGVINKIDEEKGEIIISSDPSYNQDLSQGGDSGSIWILRDKAYKKIAFGLHTQGAGSYAIAKPLINIFANLKIDTI